MLDAKTLNEHDRLFVKLDLNIIEIYKKEKLRYIREEKVEEQEITSLYHHIVDRKNKIKNFSSIDFIYDIISLSADIKYLTGMLYFLHPHINYASREDNTYFQNRFDKRYLTFAGLTIQCLYNYWDRIGDLLYAYFETGIKEDNVYLSKVLNNFPKEYRISENFISLNDIYVNDIKDLLESRHQVVHHKQLETKYFLEIIRNRDDKDQSELLEKEKTGYPDYFKQQSEVAIRGFKITLDLINELPDKE